MKLPKANLLFLISPVLILCECFYIKEGLPKTELNINSMDTTKVYVRYIADDIEKSVIFYTEFLDFKVLTQVNSGFATVAKGNLNLLLNKIGTGGSGKPMPDGTIPQPGGWNRIQIRVENLNAVVQSLSRRNAKFKNEIVVGNGGNQILLEDPSGNLIELFEANYK